MKNFRKYICFDNSNLKKTLNNIKNNRARCSVIVDKNFFLVGTITDGDIRKKILKGKINLKQKVRNICNKRPKFLLKDSLNSKKLRRLFIKSKYDVVPIVDRNKIVIDVIFKEDFLKKNKIKKKYVKSLNAIVVIMAGGFGNRLDPITKIIPKPLVPVKNQTVIELITNSFYKSGLKNFYYSVGYKKEIIKAYFKDQITKYKIKFISEKKPLGTAGALRALIGKVKSSFFVTNCDTLFKINYNKLYSFHNKNDFDITVVVAKKFFFIPYGTCEILKNNKLNKLKEKPNFNFKVLTGMYILKPKVLKLIPNNTFFNMDQLISKSITKKLSVGCYFINDKKWTDIGQLQEYKRNLKILGS